ncbi:aspartate-semialdehyde dehydrogenase [Loktanella sp. D2R18]|uniref:aspartate-semialdehyde dehydrogenase n=1 Tax=Rhodobacterales TaxID=204455 RepID=UPI000DEB4C73|nr:MULTISPECIES: aspartate-semialdehyde dehydrogenase [Rhodobacterales]MDO6589377.1 aspartate-semialdehyde dehydrogenase [Yoonia sp. 1_MG-2023]RBW45212.1 aspartate-semialdehyde dehydrogenase [Loktanella sp. D2R18]
MNAHVPPAPAPVVAIVGATGAVGLALIHSLEQRNFVVGALRLLASARSAGRSQSFRGQSIVVEELTEDSFDGVDIAFFSAGATISRRFAPIAVAAGAQVIDNSSAFRMQDDVPLIVPEANGAALQSAPRIVANPNCIAAILTTALAPLHQRWSITRLSLSTYQAASGGGAEMMEELREGTRAHLNGEDFEPQILPHSYAFNVFSHNSDIDPETGYNGEELKVIAETRRILSQPQLPISVTCIRVPILRAHGISLSIRFDEHVNIDSIRHALVGAPGIRLVDDREANHFPMPSEASGEQDVLVGRIRDDLGDPSGRTVSMFIVGDQLLKGAAQNAVQIAEALHAQAAV